MLQQLTALLPDALAHRPPAFAAVMAAAGLGLWLVGGRFSRGLLCLALVAAGAFVGMRMPRWFGWGIDGAALGIGGAILLGASGYFLDRFWTGVLFGATLGFWAGLAAWAAVAPTARWSVPAFQWTPDPVDLVLQLWRTLPEDLRTGVPLAAGLAMAAGILLTVLWPRLSRAMVFSLLGLSVWVAVVLPVAGRERPDWAALLPRGLASELVLLSGLLAVGTLVQWWFIGREPKVAAEPPSRSKTAAAAADTGRGEREPARRPVAPVGSVSPAAAGPATMLPTAPVAAVPQRQASGDAEARPRRPATPLSPVSEVLA